MTSRFRGKVVIETAGTGIGAATARRFHAKGAAVALSGRRSFSTIPRATKSILKMREELFDAVLDWHSQNAARSFYRRALMAAILHATGE
jgi:NADP-dependent 3-hydroxy acid dehydrogenase YdfG